jgi:hypothetical protein
VPGRGQEKAGAGRDRVGQTPKQTYIFITIILFDHIFTVDGEVIDFAILTRAQVGREVVTIFLKSLFGKKLQMIKAVCQPLCQRLCQAG